MRKLMTALLGLSLLVPVASFAQATGGSTGKGKAEKTKKAHKGGKKSKKGSGGGSTTPPPK